MRQSNQPDKRLELERLDALLSKPHQNALSGNLTALAACLFLVTRMGLLQSLYVSVPPDATPSDRVVDLFVFGSKALLATASLQSL